MRTLKHLFEIGVILFILFLVGLAVYFGGYGAYQAWGAGGVITLFFSCCVIALIAYKIEQFAIDNDTSKMYSGLRQGLADNQD